ncbi:helix-turn-helix domain-containing protein [bacterium]|nr:helix-turn-helix domain-containing protein [bacterium]
MGTSRFETLRPATLLSEYVTLRTNRVEDFHAYIAGMAGRIERDYRADVPVELELRHVCTGQVDLVVYFGTIDVTAEATRPLPSPFLVQFPLRGHFVAQFPHGFFDIRPGHGIVISPTQHVRRTSKPGCTLVVSVTSTLLYARAEICTGKPIDECLIFETKILPQAAEPLLEYALTFVDAVDRGVAPAGSPLAQTFENGFVDLLLELQPLQEGRKFHLADASVKLDRVRAVMDYVDTHLDEEFTVARLAEIAGCPVRALQSAFADLCRTSVLAFLKRRRLIAARERLESGMPVESIAAIALECGFTQFGRFSTDYRNEYGETPSETLERSKRPRAPGESERNA